MKTLRYAVPVLVALLAIAPAGAQNAATPDFETTAQEINRLIRDHHYNPRELEGPEYRRLEAAALELGRSAESAEAFLKGFNALWRDGPFSHVNLAPAKGSAGELAAQLDTMRIGGGGARLAWQERTAILTVSTMMGLDTIEEIEAAYDEIAAKGADKLIVDLRENGGGAFAVKPLVGHLLSKPYDAGTFASRKWFADKQYPPQADDTRKVAPWEGWSIRAFWADAQKAPLTRIRFDPMEPHFSGPVYVLTGPRTASAAEMAADAMKGSGKATVIGARTAGKMLSQMPFDVTGGFHLFLPIADYYSLTGGRIEGQGIEPDIAAEPANALDVALKK